MSRTQVNLIIAAFLGILSIAVRPIGVAMMHEERNALSPSGRTPLPSSFPEKEIALIKAHIVRQADDPSSIEIVEHSQPKRILFTAPRKGSPVSDGHYTVVSMKWHYRNLFKGMSVQHKCFLLAGNRISYELENNPDPSSSDSLIKHEIDKALVNAP